MITIEGPPLFWWEWLGYCVAVRAVKRTLHWGMSPDEIESETLRVLSCLPLGTWSASFEGWDDEGLKVNVEVYPPITRVTLSGEVGGK